VVRVTKNGRVNGWDGFHRVAGPSLLIR
jgi:hypothetical protein